MRGNHTVAEAAVRAGCRYYFGYPITPQNEIPEYMAERLSKVEGGVFIQAESEVAAINMVIGASMAGGRAMTSSSSPGISLKQEGISFLSALELPAVIVNMTRGGPGLGNIAPAQSDYFQATRGGGHGDYRNIVLGPSSGQELANLTSESFDLADIVVVTDIYPASEQPIEGLDATLLCRKIQERSPEKEIVYLQKEKIVPFVLAQAKEGDAVITLGAGDIIKICDELVENLKG